MPAAHAASCEMPDVADDAVLWDVCEWRGYQLDLPQVAAHLVQSNYGRRVAVNASKYLQIKIPA